MATATGVIASARPATKPPARPNRRRVRSWVRPTAATPMSAWGTRIDSEPNPKMRADSACTHRASGGLSTIITPLGSKDAYTKLCQLSVIDRTAAA
jgi:hypothetical protein